MSKANLPQAVRVWARGFTLVEMTVVLVIMGIFMTLGLAALTAQLNSAAASATRKKQEIIQESLIAYLRDYKRLPCPETSALEGEQPTGYESRQGDSTTVCKSFWGTVPFATLGLSKEIAIDGYDGFFTYFVSSAASRYDPDWTLTANPNITPPVPGFSVSSRGRIEVIENGVIPTEAVKPPLAAVVLVSHGKNGEGAFTSKGTRTVMPASDERKNAPDSLLVPPATSPIYTLAKRDTSDSFDDVVMVLRPNDLINPLIREGSLKSLAANQAFTAEQLLEARDIVAFKMASSNCVVPSNLEGATLMPMDAWENKITYQRNDNSAQVMKYGEPKLETVAFTVGSLGADGNNGGGDDKALTVTYGQIRDRIGWGFCTKG